MSGFNDEPTRLPEDYLAKGSQDEPTRPLQSEPPASPSQGQYGSGPSLEKQDPYGEQQYPPYGQPQPNQQPYQQPYAQPGAPMGYQPAYGYGPGYIPPPAADGAVLSLVLGLVGLIGGLMLCGLTLVLSPFAWGVGNAAIRRIDAANGQLGGRDQAQVGRVTGIIGTVLLVLGILAVIAFVVLVVATAETGTSTSNV